MTPAAPVAQQALEHGRKEMLLVDSDAEHERVAEHEDARRVRLSRRSQSAPAKPVFVEADDAGVRTSHGPHRSHARHCHPT